MRFARESLSQVRGEVGPLLEAHWTEIAHYTDIALNPDWEFYELMDGDGRLRIFTARDDGKLVGYACFFVGPNRHYKQSIQAVQDVIFLHPAYRGARLGAGLILFADEQCRSENIQVIYHHIKAAHDFGPLLVNCGYGLVDLIYAKRLDKPWD